VVEEIELLRPKDLETQEDQVEVEVEEVMVLML
jgi:hypothetical protein